MFIQTETTPNPNTLKFIPGMTVTGSEAVNYISKESADNSPLADLLFTIKNVKGVLLGLDFITITKEEEANWDILKPEILVTIMDFFVAGRPVFSSEVRKSSNQINENDDEIVKEIKEIIETRVRPAVANDGGDIIFVDFKEGVVYLELQGSCSGCPSSTVTLKNGIENMLKHYIPEIESVEQI